MVKNEIVNKTFSPRSLLLSKILKKKNKTKLAKDAKQHASERETMMMVTPESHGGGHSHHSKPKHHSKVPEGYYRCSHGCLCRKGMHHNSGQHHGHHGHHGQGGMHGGTHGGMQGGMGPGMHGQMGPGMHGQMGPGMHGAMGPGMHGGMQQMNPYPQPTNPIIQGVAGLGNTAMGLLGQGMGVANGLNQQFTSLSARKNFIQFIHCYQ
jgi:hypothetical protein